ncbi:hypothetical protein HQ447_18715 [bacterium]|nr:hypothetical protein [bacterium]
MRILPVICAHFILGSGLSALEAQSLDTDQEIALRLQTLSSGEKILSWTGQENHTFFIQATHDLSDWTWAPNIEPGIAGPMSYEVDGPTDKGFFRLVRTDQTAADPDLADFDGDQLTNLQEIIPRPRPGGTGGSSTLNPDIQTNPLDSDTDHDGLTDKWEQDNGLDPTDDGSRNIDNGPNGDPDQDGLTNAEEFAGASNAQDTRPPISQFRRIDNPDGTVTYSWISFAYQGEWFRIVDEQPGGTSKSIYATTYGSVKLPFVFGKQLYTLTLNPAVDYLP